MGRVSGVAAVRVGGNREESGRSPHISFGRKRHASEPRFEIGRRKAAGRRFLLALGRTSSLYRLPFIGVAGVVAATIGTVCVITWVSTAFCHWPSMLLGLVPGRAGRSVDQQTLPQYLAL